MIPELNPALLVDLFTVKDGQGVFNKNVPTHPHDHGHFFIAAMAMYLTTLHELVLRTWYQFKEETKEAAKKEERDEEIRDRREEAYKAAQLLSEIRHYETFLDNAEGKILADNLGKFKIYEGEFDQASRHLISAI